MRSLIQKISPGCEMSHRKSGDANGFLQFFYGGEGGCFTCTFLTQKVSFRFNPNRQIISYYDFYINIQICLFDIERKLSFRTN